VQDRVARHTSTYLDIFQLTIGIYVYGP
jgi:hypothetical protein